jgi:NitT/TauT family transport system substrate-binding protein
MRRALTAWVAGVVLSLGVAACGDDEEAPSAGGGGGQEQVTLKVGVIPIADVAPLYLGIKKGFFKEENLTIEPQLAEGGAAIIPSVMSGDYQIGFSNAVSLLIAASKDLPVQIIAQGVLGGTTQDDAWDAVVVPKGSDVKSIEDLAGKTIAVNTLNNICGVTINASLEKEGVDINQIKYTEIPFPEMIAALEKDQVDGACVVEPFVSAGKGAGMKGIDPFYFNTAPNLTVATYFASKEYIAKNEAVVDRFVAAMKKSLEYAQAHPDEVRGVLTEYTEIPPEAAQKINLPQWGPDLTMDTIEELSSLSKKYGYLEEEPDLSELIRE